MRSPDPCYRRSRYLPQLSLSARICSNHREVAELSDLFFPCCRQCRPAPPFSQTRGFARELRAAPGGGGGGGTLRQWSKSPKLRSFLEVKQSHVHLYSHTIHTCTEHKFALFSQNSSMHAVVQTLTTRRALSACPSPCLSHSLRLSLSLRRIDTERQTKTGTVVTDLLMVADAWQEANGKKREHSSVRPSTKFCSATPTPTRPCSANLVKDALESDNATVGFRLILFLIILNCYTGDGAACANSKFTDYCNGLLAPGVYHSCLRGYYNSGQFSDAPVSYPIQVCGISTHPPHPGLQPPKLCSDENSLIRPSPFLRRSTPLHGSEPPLPYTMIRTTHLVLRRPVLKPGCPCIERILIWKGN